MEVDAPHGLHVPVERRVAVAVVQVPLLDDAILVGRVHIVVGVGEANAFDARVMTVERLKLIKGEICASRGYFQSR